jgi:hypothetical protein
VEREKTIYKKMQGHFIVTPKKGNRKTLHRLSIRHPFSKTSNSEPEGRINRKPWHFSTKTKSIIAFAIIAIMLVSVFAFLPKENQSQAMPQNNDTSTTPSPTIQQTPGATNKPVDVGQILNHVVTGITDTISPRGPGAIESAQTINSTVWRAVAKNAWSYFEPNIGVDIETGLPCGVYDWYFFTDWDLGVYIQAVMDANRTGLIGNDGAWGSTSRLEKVLTFLETRDLNQYNYPYWFYDAQTGNHSEEYSSGMSVKVDGTDTGRLFVALNNLKDFNPQWKDRINNIVYNNVTGQVGKRSDYAALINGLKTANDSSIYTYFVMSGFASFWPELQPVTTRLLNNIMNSGTVTSYNASLPKAEILCEPLLYSMFELKSNPQITSLARAVYLAHEAKYNATGQYVAFSEGNYGSVFIYEWVVLPDGRTWNVTDINRNSYDVNPIVYTKVSFSFLALYNTSFARNMTVFLEKTLPDASAGYGDGANSDGSTVISQIGTNTNGLILAAARYYIQNNPSN